MIKEYFLRDKIEENIMINKSLIFKVHIFVGHTAYIDQQV